MKSANNKPVSSFTITPALTTKPLSYRNHKGMAVEVPANTYIYVDTASNVALIGKDHVDIFSDEYTAINN